MDGFFEPAKSAEQQGSIGFLFSFSFEHKQNKSNPTLTTSNVSKGNS